MLPAYGGLLSTMGLAFLLETAYLLPLTAASLLVAVGALRFRARRRRGNGPFYVGLLAAGVVIGGKFVLGSALVMYGGIGLLVCASIWNTWPKGTRRDHPIRAEMPGNQQLESQECDHGEV